MLALDKLRCVLSALDRTDVQQIILVGDANQLPPIGVGRPFTDLVAFLDNAAESEDGSGTAVAEALVRPTIALRTVQAAASDARRPARAFTARQPTVARERIAGEQPERASCT